MIDTYKALEDENSLFKKMEGFYPVIQDREHVPEIVLEGTQYFGSIGTYRLNKTMTREQFLDMVKIDEMLKDLQKRHPEYFDVTTIKRL